MTDTRHSAAPETRAGEVHTIHLPAPTAWPVVLALGITLLVASLVTNVAIGALGLAISIIASIGWFREVLPHEAHETIAIAEAPVAFAPAPERVARIEIDETHRAQLPLEIFPISSGIIGGIAGGIAMVIPAEIYGVLRFHSIWYVVNLLGGAGVGNWINPTIEEMRQFRLSAFITANIIQGATTLLVGILYGAMLPIWPRRPILLGGIIAPAAWTGLLYSTLGFVNPFLQERIDWWSFGASQVVFGLVAGYTVTRLGNLRRLRQIALPQRLGLESPGLEAERHETDTNKKEPMG
jgi:hypothetical protein